MNTDERIEQLARQLEASKASTRRTRGLAVLALILAVAVAARGEWRSGRGIDNKPTRAEAPALNSTDTYSVIRAKEIEIVGDDGKPRVRLATASDYGAITTMTATGTPAISLGGQLGATHTIATHDGDGHRIVEMSVSPGGTGALVVKSASGRQLAIMESIDGKHGLVRTCNEVGGGGVTIGFDEFGGGLVALMGPNGLPIVGLGYDEGNASGQVSIWDAEPAYATLIGAGQLHAVAIQGAGQEETALWSLGYDEAGALFQLRNVLGNTLLELGGDECAGRIVVGDDLGRPKVLITQQQDGGAILTMNSEGSALVSIGAKEMRPALALHDVDGSELVSLGTDRIAGNGQIAIANTDGERLVGLACSPLGSGAIVTKNAQGVPIVIVGSLPNGAGSVQVHNQEGNMLALIGATDSGSGGALGILNAVGIPLVELKGVDAGGQVLLHNKTGENVVQALVDEYGMGFVGAFNREGTGQVIKPR